MQENKIIMDFDIDEFKEIICKYKGKNIFSKNPTIYSIPFSHFQYVNEDIRHLALYKIQFENFFSYLNIPVVVKLCYNTAKMIILEVENIMFMERVLINLNYGNRDKHIELIKSISELVSDDGKVGFFVDNIPYCLEITLVVSTSKNYNEIINLAKEYNLTLDYSRHIPELIEDLKQRRCYDFIEIGIDTSAEEIEMILNNGIIKK